MSNFSKKRQESFFNHFIQGMDTKLQAQLAFEFQRMLMLERYEHEREMKKLKEEIVQEVLARISVSIDVSDVIEEIEELRRAIDSLGERR